MWQQSTTSFNLTRHSGFAISLKRGTLRRASLTNATSNKCNPPTFVTLHSFMLSQVSAHGLTRFVSRVGLMMCLFGLEVAHASLSALRANGRG